MKAPREIATLDRREFIYAGGAATVAVMLPLPTAFRATRLPEPMLHTQPVADWSIDDMWMGFPRNSEAIGFGRPRPQPIARVAVVDEQFIP